jgi:hypothetical protein
VEHSKGERVGHSSRPIRRTEFLVDPQQMRLGQLTS